MKIIRMKNKVKILFDYSLSLSGYEQISHKDLEKLNIKIFLKDGTEVNGSFVDMITLSVKEIKRDE